MSESAENRQTHTGPMGPARATSSTGAQINDPRTVGRLVRELVDDVATLVRKELALASSEISHSIDAAKAGAGAAVAGGAVLYAGLLFLLLAATFGLAEVVPAWAAALIVGGVVTLVGFILFQSGKSKMQPGSFAPNRTSRSLHKDKEMLERQPSVRHEPERQPPYGQSSERQPS